MLLGLWAQFRVKGTFNKYSQVRSQRGMTGAEAARQILDRAGLREVTVERATAFFLTITIRAARPCA